MELNQVSNIQDHIEFGNDLIISHSKLHLKAKVKDKYGVDLIHCVSPFIGKYMDLLQPYIKKVHLSEEEYLKYRYRPKSLSLEQYDTTELWSAILLINNMTSAVQFNKRSIFMFTDDIMDILEEILILEEANIRKNDDYIYKED